MTLYARILPAGWALVKSFFLQQALLREIEFSGIFKNGSFSIPPAQSMRRLFSDIHSEDLVGLLEVKPTEV